MAASDIRSASNEPRYYLLKVNNKNTNVTCFSVSSFLFIDKFEQEFTYLLFALCK